MSDDNWLDIDDPVELGKMIAERALKVAMKAMQRRPLKEWRSNERGYPGAVEGSLSATV